FGRRVVEEPHALVAANDGREDEDGHKASEEEIRFHEFSSPLRKPPKPTRSDERRAIVTIRPYRPSGASAGRLMGSKRKHTRSSALLSRAHLRTRRRLPRRVGPPGRYCR